MWKRKPGQGLEQLWKLLWALRAITLYNWYRSIFIFERGKGYQGP